MFEISELKAKKLPELQELAKALGVPKLRSLKKLDLVYKILDYQASNPKAVTAITKEEVKINPTPKQIQPIKDNTPKQVHQREKRPQPQRNDPKTIKSPVQKPNHPQQKKTEEDEKRSKNEPQKTQPKPNKPLKKTAK